MLARPLRHGPAAAGRPNLPPAIDPFRAPQVRTRDGAKGTRQACTSRRPGAGAGGDGSGGGGAVGTTRGRRDCPAVRRRPSVLCSENRLPREAYFASCQLSEPAATPTCPFEASACRGRRPDDHVGAGLGPGREPAAPGSGGPDGAGSAPGLRPLRRGGRPGAHERRGRQRALGALRPGRAVSRRNISCRSGTGRSPGGAGPVRAQRRGHARRNAATARRRGPLPRGGAPAGTRCREPGPGRRRCPTVRVPRRRRLRLRQARNGRLDRRLAQHPGPERRGRRRGGGRRGGTPAGGRRPLPGGRLGRRPGGLAGSLRWRARRRRVPDPAQHLGRSVGPGGDLARRRRRTRQGLLPGRCGRRHARSAAAGGRPPGAGRTVTAQPARFPCRRPLQHAGRRAETRQGADPSGVRRSRPQRPRRQAHGGVAAGRTAPRPTPGSRQRAGTPEPGT